MIPNVAHPINGGGPPDPVWRAFFERLSQTANADAIVAICYALGSPDGTPQGIPEATIQAVAPLQIMGQNTIGLAYLSDDGTGTFQLLTRDAYGRLQGTQEGAAADVPYDNATSGLSATDVQAAIDEVSASSGGGGILPMVNGDVPPTLMYFDDGSLLYAQVE